MSHVADGKYPKHLYHETRKPEIVYSVQQEADLGPEWSETYIKQRYPTWRYHWYKDGVIVDDPKAELALGGGWTDHSENFSPYLGPRSRRTDRSDPTKWVDVWPVPGLSPEYRRMIKARLLRADASFWRSSDVPTACVEPMRIAFDEVAKVLSQGKILTEGILENDIPILIWDSAVSGGWYRPASEEPNPIFPERVGHYWLWRDDRIDWKGIFVSEIADWRAWLLENTDIDNGEVAPAVPQTDKPAVSARDLKPAHLPEERGVPRAVGDDFDFSNEQGRIAALDEYCGHWTCAEASFARAATVDPADLSKWKKGQLPSQSIKRDRIEAALRHNSAPVPPPERPDW